VDGGEGRFHFRGRGREANGEGENAGSGGQSGREEARPAGEAETQEARERKVRPEPQVGARGPRGRVGRRPGARRGGARCRAAGRSLSLSRAGLAGRGARGAHGSRRARRLHSVGTAVAARGPRARTVRRTRAASLGRPGATPARAPVRGLGSGARGPAAL
jgi:hypothetical protein